MGPYKRNFFVGATILLGLVTLGVLIILFGGSLGSLFAGEKIKVSFICDRADGLSDGSAIKYLGTQVGTVTGVELKLDESPNRVVIHAELDKDKPLPADVIGSIKLPNFLGAGSIIELIVNDKSPSPNKLLGGERIRADYVGLGVLPPEFSELATEMKKTVQDFREGNIIIEVRTTVKNFNAQLDKAGKVLDSIDAVLGSQVTQSDLKTAIAQFREATQRANQVAANFEKFSVELQALPKTATDTMGEIRGAATDARTAIKTTEDKIASTSGQIDRNLEKLALVLDDFKDITQKINAGEGTVGLLVNDPKLYEQLVAGTETINLTVKDIQRLVQQYEQEGLPIKFK